jgi:YidC/Oxa1 family membrane protein insertase
MDKRVIYAVVVSMAIVFLWTQFFAPKPKPAGEHPIATATGAQPASEKPASEKPATDKATSEKPATDKAASEKPATDKIAAEKNAADKSASDKSDKAGEKPPAGEKPAAVNAGSEKPAEQIATFEQPGHYRASFTSWGAAPQHWVLLNPQYKEDNPKATNKQAQPMDLIKTPAPDLLTTISFPQTGSELAPDAAWTEQPRGSDGSLVYTWDSGDTHVEKRLTMVPGTYETHMTVTVENRGDKPIAHAFRVQMHGWHDPTVKSGGFLSRRQTQTEGICDVGGKLKKGNLEALEKQAIDAPSNARWVGVGEQYFVTAAAVKQEANESHGCNVYGLSDGRISSTLKVQERTVPPHGKTSYELALFFGPKILSQLDAVKAGGTDAGMGTAVDYGWTEAIARPMLAILKGIHVVVPNWGVAIIIVTLMIKAVTWWPTTRSMKSMKAMAKLKPEMDALKVKYGDDKQAMNAEVMTLYKKHGVNPLGGCLPMLIQMPIFFALFSMLNNSVELYRANFVFWIHDLTAPDPYYVLPLSMGAMMFVQQRLSPTPPDQQQKVMMYMMPVMFTAFSLFVPSGLTLYYLVNTLLTMFQQWWMNRHEEKPVRPKMTPKTARA